MHNTNHASKQPQALVGSNIYFKAAVLKCVILRRNTKLYTKRCVQKTLHIRAGQKKKIKKLINRCCFFKCGGFNIDSQKP